MVSNNCDCTYNCVMTDYLGPYPVLDDCQFEEVFGVSRSLVKFIIGHLANDDPCWTQIYDAFG
eukprot:15065355-Ditylum_brightwellii.AAC.1